MDVAANRWPRKKRLLYVYLPAFLAITLLFEIASDNHLTLFDLLSCWVELFVFFYVACLLLYGVTYHAFDFLKWVAKGMKEKPDY